MPCQHRSPERGDRCRAQPSPPPPHYRSVPPRAHLPVAGFDGFDHHGLFGVHLGATLLWAGLCEQEDTGDGTAGTRGTGAQQWDWLNTPSAHGNTQTSAPTPGGQCGTHGSPTCQTGCSPPGGRFAPTPGTPGDWSQVLFLMGRCSPRKLSAEAKVWCMGMLILWGHRGEGSVSASQPAPALGQLLMGVGGSPKNQL